MYVTQQPLPPCAASASGMACGGIINAIRCGLGFGTGVPGSEVSIPLDERTKHVGEDQVVLLFAIEVDTCIEVLVAFSDTKWFSQTG